MGPLRVVAREPSSDELVRVGRLRGVELLADEQINFYWVLPASVDTPPKPSRGRKGVDLIPTVSTEHSWSRPQRHESLGRHFSGWRHRC